jgi:hypothetical protein
MSFWAPAGEPTKTNDSTSNSVNKTNELLFIACFPFLS